MMKKKNEKKRPVAIPSTVHKDVGQFCLDYGYKYYQALTEGFYLLRDKKEKEKKSK